MSILQNLIFSGYDRGTFVVKQTTNTKYTAESAIWSDDAGDLAFELQPDVVYRIWLMAIFKVSSGAGSPGALMRLKNDANITVLNMRLRGSTGWRATTPGAAIGLIVGRHALPVIMANNYYLTGQTQVATTTHLPAFFEGMVACQGSSAILTPEWKFATDGALGNIQFLSKLSWMWVRAEGSLA